MPVAVLLLQSWHKLVLPNADSSANYCTERLMQNKLMALRFANSVKLQQAAATCTATSEHTHYSIYFEV
jgi:hypothetical protein